MAKFVIATALLATLVGVCVAPAWAGHGGLMGFDPAIEKKEAEAKAYGRPRVYYFTAEW